MKMKNLFNQIKTSTKSSFSDLIVIVIDKEYYYLTTSHFIMDKDWFFGILPSTAPNSMYALNRKDFIEICEFEAHEDGWDDDIYMSRIDAALQGEAKFIILDNPIQEVDDILFEKDRIIYKISSISGKYLCADEDTGYSNSDKKIAYNVLLVSTNIYDPTDVIVKSLALKQNAYEATDFLADYLLLGKDDPLLFEVLDGGYIQNDGDGNGNDNYDCKYFIVKTEIK